MAFLLLTNSDFYEVASRSNNCLFSTPNRSYLCPKKARYERFFFHPPNFRCHPPRYQQIHRLHPQHLRGLQRGAQHRPRLHHRQDAVHPLGSRQTNALQHHRRHRVFRPPNRRLIMQAIHIPPPCKILDSPEPVDIRLWTRCISLKYDFYKGRRRMKLLDSNQIRQLRDVCIFEVNGIKIFMQLQ